MTEHNTELYTRKPEDFQVMKFKGFSQNLDEVLAWIDAIGGYVTGVHTDHISIVTDDTSYRLHPDGWVVATSPFTLEVWSSESFNEHFDKKVVEDYPRCQMSSGGFSDKPVCRVYATYAFTLDNGQKTHRCKHHMAMNLTRMQLTNSELQTIQKIGDD